jgi:hypothetical protein
LKSRGAAISAAARAISFRARAAGVAVRGWGSEKMVLVRRPVRRRIARARRYARRTFLLGWGAAGLAIIVQLLTPMALLYLWLRSPTASSHLPSAVLPYATVLVFMAGYVCIMVLGTAASIILKAAIKGYSSGTRSLVIFLMSIGLYLFVAFMGAVVGREAPKLPGQVPVLLTFYIALYVMFSGWTTKHIWDRITDDGRDRLHLFLAGRAMRRRAQSRLTAVARRS